MASIVATRYAQALFELAVELDKLDVIQKDLVRVVDVIRENETLVLILKNPNIEKKDIKDMISKIFSDVDMYTTNFLMVLVDKRRFLYISEIGTIFTSLFNKERNIEIAYVSSARVLSDDECKRIRVMLEKRTKKQVILELKTDETLMAGICIHIAGEVLDNTIQNQFVKLKKQMTKNVLV